MIDSLDPNRVHPLPGKLLIRVDEVLGGTTPGGLFLPPDVADANGKKDTVWGTILRIGDPVRIRLHKGAPKQHPEDTHRDTDLAPTVLDLRPEDRVTIPRDVPLLFVHDDQRYALVYADEVLFHHPVRP